MGLPSNQPESRVNNAPFSLRPERPQDEPFLLELYSSTRADEMQQVPWQESQKEAFLRMQFQLQTVHYRKYYPDASFQIILSEDCPIGRLYVDAGQEGILIIDVALLPQYRGKGIGGHIMEDLLRKAVAESKPVRIHVERENRALRLYRRMGFQVIEDKGIYLYMEWRPGNRPGPATPTG
jgi:ribosomal protein S18 acetylase RimI-like enzyme